MAAPSFLSTRRLGKRGSPIWENPCPVVKYHSPHLKRIPVHDVSRHSWGNLQLFVLPLLSSALITPRISALRNWRASNALGRSRSRCCLHREIGRASCRERV